MKNIDLGLQQKILNIILTLVNTKKHIELLENNMFPIKIFLKRLHR